MRISVCLQFTKYGLVFMWHVVTANKFGKGVYVICFAGYQCETYNNPADYYMDVIMDHEATMRKGIDINTKVAKQ